MNTDTHNSLHFLKSAFSEKGAFSTTEDLLKWVKSQNEKVSVKISRIPFNDLKLWEFDSDSIRHKTGKFFSINGIHVKTNWGKVAEWEQPIINQQEVGYLGFITKEFDGILHFLVQAKIEPGNVNYVQLSPTLQATRSNYKQEHKGKKPLYLDYFINAGPQEILLDQLQSEQGARFLRKRNRNIIIKIEGEIPLYDNFTWVTLAQLKKLMEYDNIINMDTRTVISGIPFGKYPENGINSILVPGIIERRDTIKESFLKSALSREGALHSTEEIITLLTHIKSNYDLDIIQIPLSKLIHWKIGESEIYHEENKYFKIIALNIEIGNREVLNWSQPMIEPAQEGICAFVCKEINGLLHFAVQAKMECGNKDIIEFSPTVQCLTGNYRTTTDGSLPFLHYILQAKKEQVVFDSMQSEEGGRFYHEQNRNMIVLAKDEIPIELPENYIWMTLHQLYSFLKYNNYINIQARSLIASISFI